MKYEICLNFDERSYRTVDEEDLEEFIELAKKKEHMYSIQYWDEDGVWTALDFDRDAGEWVFVS